MRRVLAVLAVLAACDDGGSIVDAGLIDSPPRDCDCVPDTAMPSPVRVVVVDRSGPLAGMPVYFLDPAGALVAQQDTDATGVASAIVAAGSSVTGVLPDPFSGSPRLMTALGVAPGDVIAMRARGGGADMAMTLTIPANGTDGHYVVTSPCGSTEVLVEAGLTVDVPMTLSGCGATTTFLVRADNGGPVSSFVLGDVAVADGMAVTVTGTYAPDVDVTSTYTNLAGGVSFVQLGRAVVAHDGVIATTTIGVDATAGTAAGTLAIPALPPPPAPAVVVASAQISRTNSQSIVLAPAGADFALDTTGVFLPAFATPAQFDLTTHQVMWTEDPTGAAPDLTFATLQINRSSQKATWYWDLVAPHGTATQVTYPVLPADAAEFNPTVGDDVFINQHLTGKVPGGYAAARAVALAVRDLDELGRSFTGRVVLERQQLLSKRAPRR